MKGGAVWLPEPREYQGPVLDSSARFKLLICGRRWGKTKVGLLAAAGGHGPVVGRERRHRGALHGGRIGWIVPSEDHPAAAEVWADLKTALRPSATLVSEARKAIGLPGGGSIRLWSGFDPDHLRGPYFDGVVVDECSLQQERVWHALRPTLSDYGGWGLLLGTVPEDVAAAILGERTADRGRPGGGAGDAGDTDVSAGVRSGAAGARGWGVEGGMVPAV